MQVYSILVHPNTDSLNHALFAKAHEAFDHLGFKHQSLDLYRSRFDPWSMQRQFTKKISLPGIGLISSFTDKWLLARRAGLLSRFCEEEISKILNCDILYVQTPLWWWSYPSLFKAYIEQVFAFGVAFSHTNVETRNDQQAKHQHGFLGKRVMLGATLGGSREFMMSHFDSEQTLFATCQAQLQGLCGFEWTEPYVVWGVGAASKLNPHGADLAPHIQGIYDHVITNFIPR